MSPEERQKRKEHVLTRGLAAAGAMPYMVETILGLVPQAFEDRLVSGP